MENKEKERPSYTGKLNISGERESEGGLGIGGVALAVKQKRKASTTIAEYVPWLVFGSF